MHKKTRDALWLDSYKTPQWVLDRIGSLPKRGTAGDAVRPLKYWTSTSPTAGEVHVMSLDTDGIYWGFKRH